MINKISFKKINEVAYASESEVTNKLLNFLKHEYKNRINNIDSSSDVPTGTTYVASTEPDGDNNAMVYVTRKVSLKTPATSLKVLSDNFRPANTELKVLYKILRNDDSTPFDDVGFEYFNTTGGPDTAIETDSKNFKEYEYTATELDEFSAFAIKIVGQGSNTSVVPIVSAFTSNSTI